ncbi:MAG: single-stranded DNA-binding protein [Anaerolineales bacterium]
MIIDVATMAYSTFNEESIMTVNKIILVGHLGKDPELRRTPAGAVVASFTLATNEFYIDKQGQSQTLTEWHNIVAWEKLAEICGKYLHKGAQVYLSGRIQYRTYEDRNGTKRNLTEIVIDDMQLTKGSQVTSNHPPSGHVATDDGYPATGYENPPW